MDKRTGDLDIEDSFMGSDSHEFEWFFHASPGTQVEFTKAGFLLHAKERSITLLYDDPALQCENTDGWYSPSYGIRERASRGFARKACPTAKTRNSDCQQLCARFWARVTVPLSLECPVRRRNAVAFLFVFITHL